MTQNTPKNKGRKEEPPKLKRAISLPLVVFYGLGTMVGAGIYALTGKVAGAAGIYAPVSFLVAALLAFITAFSYAELAARYPYSAGEVKYVHEGFNWAWFSKLVGVLIVMTGVVSSATLMVATAGFLRDFVTLSPELSIGLITLIMGGFALWGIRESALLVAAITLIELGGLVFIIVISADSLGDLPVRWPEFIPPSSMSVWLPILSGAFLAFYAFVGFEDMVNVAEEVKDVQRNLPLAILICISVTLVLYVLIALVAVLSVEPEVLAASNTPLAEIAAVHGYNNLPIIGLISLLAASNGALVQMIMVSRVLYGMAMGGKAPKFLAYISPLTRTPVIATVLTIGVILALALSFDLTTLAKFTSAIILFVFASVNVALIVIRRREPELPEGLVHYPIWVPALGFIVCSAMFVFSILYEFLQVLS